MQKIKTPSFKTIKTDSIEKTLKKILASNRQALKKILERKSSFTWQNLMLPLEKMHDELHQFWSKISHLHSVKDSPELRKAYNRCLPLLSRYSSEIAHNKKLYHAILSLKNNGEIFEELTDDQKKVVEDELRDFKLSGIALSPKDKKIFKQLEKELSQLTTKFSENVLDATQTWSYQTPQIKELSGLPSHLIEQSAALAKSINQEGYLLTLDFPTYLGVMMYADNRNLRKLMYQSFVTRASDKGCVKEFDNSKIMDRILAIRYQLASLLGFRNYADYSLATKMAQDTKTVYAFIENLVRYLKPLAKKEYQELKDFARKNHQVKQLKPWDIAYFSEKLKQTHYNISQEELREYFPEKKVLAGLFKLAEQLFGIRIREKINKDVWDPAVRYFEVLDKKKQLRGNLYIDLYVRSTKRSGAWMDECRDRWRISEKKLQTPIAFLVCNFSKPNARQKSFLTFEEVQTLFHEFGHTLHHLLTQIDYPEISGINGLEWDAVELPSQLMENFCWDYRVLQMITAHKKTKKTLSRHLHKKLLASKNFQVGLKTIRQLTFALFDFYIHDQYQQKGFSIQESLESINKKIGVIPSPSYNRFAHSFSHIFAGGYAAGYYSYLWAEVLSADIFEKFKRSGVVNKIVGQAFLKNILEKGGSKKALDLFIDFQGREPTVDALIKYFGLTTKKQKTKNRTSHTESSVL